MHILLIAAAVATLTITIGSSGLSCKYLQPRLPAFFQELMACPYCLSHWIAAPITALSCNSVFEWFICWLAVVAISQIFILPITMVLNASRSAD